jgi:tRNA U55 pseudouridine synthase TruB
MYLAGKLKGARAYALARKGDRPELHPRSIVIHSFFSF